MDSSSDKHQRHQVKLPSGKEIEVVYLDHLSGETELNAVASERGESTHPAASSGLARLKSRRSSVATPLHVCPSCSGQLVHPLDWSEEREGYWRILLRCPDCEETREGVFGQAAVEALDEELDRATGELLSDFRRMTHANMAQEIEFFVRALQADVIVPSDF